MSDKCKHCADLELNDSILAALKELMGEWKANDGQKFDSVEPETIRANVKIVDEYVPVLSEWIRWLVWWYVFNGQRLATRLQWLANERQQFAAAAKAAGMPGGYEPGLADWIVKLRNMPRTEDVERIQILSAQLAAVRQEAEGLRGALQAMVDESLDTFNDPECMSAEWKVLVSDAQEALSPVGQEDAT